MAQLQAMSHNAGGAGQKVRDLESILEEWNDNFGRGTDEGFQGIFGIVPMTPTALKNTLIAQRKRVKELEAQLEEGRQKVVLAGKLLDLPILYSRLQWLTRALQRDLNDSHKIFQGALGWREGRS